MVHQNDMNYWACLTCHYVSYIFEKKSKISFKHLHQFFIVQWVPMLEKNDGATN